MCVESLIRRMSVVSLFTELGNQTDSVTVRGAEPKAALSSEEAVQDTRHDPCQHE